MLAIKLQRIGRKHQPSFRLVVAERRSRMPGPPVEDLGSYNPDTKSFEVKKDRVTYWVGVGAQPTLTVHNLLVKYRVITEPKKKINIGQPKKKEEQASAPTAPAEETPAVAPEEATVEVTPAEEPPTA